MVQEVSSIFKETSGQAVQQAVKAIPFKNVTCSSTTAEEMDKPFQMQEVMLLFLSWKGEKIGLIFPVTHQG